MFRIVIWCIILCVWLFTDIILLFIPDKCHSTELCNIELKPYATLFHIYAYIDLVLFLCLNFPVALYLVRSDKNWFSFGPRQTVGSLPKKLVVLTCRSLQILYVISTLVWDGFSIYRLTKLNDCLKACPMVWGLVGILSFHAARILLVVVSEFINWICTPVRPNYHPIATYETETTDISGFYH
jgi:hypothetical protein